MEIFVNTEEALGLYPLPEVGTGTRSTQPSFRPTYGDRTLTEGLTQTIRFSRSILPEYIPTTNLAVGCQGEPRAEVLFSRKRGHIGTQFQANEQRRFQSDAGDGCEIHPGDRPERSLP